MKPGAAALCLLAGLLFIGCSAQAGKIAAAAETKAAFPAFSVKTLKGTTVSLGQYKGKIVILDLFASWCPPCKMEIPHFVQIQAKHKDTVAVVGLSYDETTPEKLQGFITEMKINYDVYWGSQEIAQYVGLRGIPHTLVLDQQGRVFHSYIGYQGQDVFEADIKALSSAPAANPTVQ